MSIKIVVVDAGRLPPDVEFLAFPGVDCTDPYDAQAIDHFAIRGETNRRDV